MIMLVICGSNFEFKRRCSDLIKQVPWYKRLFIRIIYNKSGSLTIGKIKYIRVYHTDQIRGIVADSYFVWNEDITLKNEEELILACRFACLAI